MTPPQSIDFDVCDTNANSTRDAEVHLLYQALAVLPDEQKECIILFYFYIGRGELLYN